MNANTAALERDLLQGVRIMEGMRMTEGFGHLSARASDGTVWITPAQAPGLTTSGQFLRFTIDGKLLHQGDIPPALETPMHLAILRARPDVNAICRIHAPFTVSYGVRNAPLPLLHGFGLCLSPQTALPCHPVLDLITDRAAADALAATLNDHHALLIRGNGALATGASIATAVVRAIFLEEAARIAIHSASHSPALPSPQELAARRRWHDTELARAWPYYCRKFPLH